VVGKLKVSYFIVVLTLLSCWTLSLKSHSMEQNCIFTSPVRVVGGSYEVPDPSPGSINLSRKSSPAFYRTPTTKVRRLSIIFNCQVSWWLIYLVHLHFTAFNEVWWGKIAFADLAPIYTPLLGSRWICHRRSPPAPPAPLAAHRTCDVSTSHPHSPALCPPAKPRL